MKGKVSNDIIPATIEAGSTHLILSLTMVRVVKVRTPLALSLLAVLGLVIFTFNSSYDLSGFWRGYLTLLQLKLIVLGLYLISKQLKSPSTLGSKSTNGYEE
jgi:hypothetical protein